MQFSQSNSLRRLSSESLTDMAEKRALLDVLGDKSLLSLWGFFAAPATSAMQINVWYFSESSRRDKEQYKWDVESVHWAGKSVVLGLGKRFAPLGRLPKCKVRVESLGDKSDNDPCPKTGEFPLQVCGRASGVYARAGKHTIEGALPFCSRSFYGLFDGVTAHPPVFEIGVRPLGEATFCNPLRSRKYFLVCSAPAQARRLVRKSCEEGLFDALCRCGQPKASLDGGHVCRPASPERWGSDAEPNDEESASPSDGEADEEETSSCTSCIPIGSRFSDRSDSSSEETGIA